MTSEESLVHLQSHHPSWHWFRRSRSLSLGDHWDRAMLSPSGWCVGPFLNKDWEEAQKKTCLKPYLSSRMRASYFPALKYWMCFIWKYCNNFLLLNKTPQLITQFMQSLMNQPRCGEYLPWGKYWWKKVGVKVLVTQLCPSLCDPIACSQPGSSVHGILQASILEQVAIPLSRRSSWPRDGSWVSCIAGGHQGSLCETTGIPWRAKPESACPREALSLSERGVCVLVASHVCLFAIAWTIAQQAPLSMEFFRQEYWNGLPFPSLEDFPDPGIEPRSPCCRRILYHLSHQGSRKMRLSQGVTQL